MALENITENLLKLKLIMGITYHAARDLYKSLKEIDPDNDLLVQEDELERLWKKIQDTSLNIDSDVNDFINMSVMMLFNKYNVQHMLNLQMKKKDENFPDSVLEKGRERIKLMSSIIDPNWNY